MNDIERGHKPVEECEYIRGMYVYQDDETDQWVAYLPHHPLSAVGQSKSEAIENCKAAADGYFEDETTYWDDWRMACPTCDGDWGLAPVKAGCFDPSDYRVRCDECDTIFELSPTCETGPSEADLVKWQRTVSHLLVRCRDEGLLAHETDEERVEELVQYLEHLRARESGIEVCDGP